MSLPERPVDRTLLREARAFVASKQLQGKDTLTANEAIDFAIAPRTRNAVGGKVK